MYYNGSEIIQLTHNEALDEKIDISGQRVVWNNRTATFMILGDICTRSCKFCATKSGQPMSRKKSLTPP